jgi:hypothetical protein
MFHGRVVAVLNQLLEQIVPVGTTIVTVTVTGARIVVVPQARYWVDGIGYLPVAVGSIGQYGTTVIVVANVCYGLSTTALSVITCTVNIRIRIRAIVFSLFGSLFSKDCNILEEIKEKLDQSALIVSTYSVR